MDGCVCARARARSRARCGGGRPAGRACPGSSYLRWTGRSSGVCMREPSWLRRGPGERDRAPSFIIIVISSIIIITITAMAWGARCMGFGQCFPRQAACSRSPPG